MTARYRVGADYVMHLRICTRPYCKWQKTGGTRPTCTHISPWYIICETHTTSIHIQSKRVRMGTFL